MLNFEELSQKTSDEIIAICNEKYGLVQNDYFKLENGGFRLTASGNPCKNGDIIRTNDGLFVHHIKENVSPSLSEPSIAIQNPAEYQKKEFLVYVNFLEHFLIHLKIYDESKGELSWNGSIKIDSQLNNMFINGFHPGEKHWKHKIWKVIEPEMTFYLKCKELFINLVMKHKNVDRQAAVALITQAEDELGWYNKQ